MVISEISRFIRDGGNVFAKHVFDVDPDIRCGDEVIVVDKKDTLLGTGRASLCPSEILEFDRGPAVEVRSGVDED